MRIIDCSSDVCSYDHLAAQDARTRATGQRSRDRGHLRIDCRLAHWRTPDIAPTMVILLTDMSPVFSKPARACSLRAVALGGPHQIFLDLSRRRPRLRDHESYNRGRLDLRQLSLAISPDSRRVAPRSRPPKTP